MLRLLFAGTPAIAVQTLDALIRSSGSGFTVAGVLTNPDRPVGRGRRRGPSPVKVRSVEHGIPVLQPDHLDGAAREEVVGLAPDLLVVVAFGRIFGPKFLSLFPAGAINMHPSLLPRYRGPSPIQAAILAGDTETGVSVQEITEEMDAGPILFQRRRRLTGEERADELGEELGKWGAEAVVETVLRIAEGTAEASPQDHDAATYCRLVKKSDGYLTLHESAVQIDRMVRAYSPWPGVSALWKGRRLQLVDVVPPATGEGSADVGGAEGGKDLSRGVGAAGRGSNLLGTPASSSPQASPGTILGVDNGLGILLQTSDGILAIRAVKPEARSVMDFAAFTNGAAGLIGSTLERI